MNTSPRKIKFAILGFRPTRFGIRGFATPTEDGGWEPIPGVEFTASADLSEDACRDSRERFGFKRTYTDYRELLRKETLDAVLITLPTFMHKQATLDCLAAGVHVLCEKPPANDYEEILEVAEAVEKSDKQYMFVRQSRFGAAAQATRKLVVSGKLGTVYAGETKWVRTRGIQVRGDSWRTDRSKGGGVLIDLGIHGLDLLWYCMGNPRPVEVSASETSAFKQYAPDPSVYTADDNFNFWIRFENDAVIQGTFAFGMNQVGPKGPKKPELDHSDDWQVNKIFGTDGGIDIGGGKIVEGPSDSYTVSDLEVDPALVGINPMITQAKHFVECVQQNKKPQNTIEQAVELMKMLGSLSESARTKRAIRLDNI
tara:strand:- start:10607 stop:11713 length:1107 start_codon:yes stop_codon:yes gene_type:complete